MSARGAFCSAKRRAATRIDVNVDCAARLRQRSLVNRMSYGLINRVVLTSGTSALTARNLLVEWASATGLIKVEGPRVCCPTDDVDAAVSSFKSALANTLPTVEAAQLKQVSAECAVLHALYREKRLAVRPLVSIIHSDTFGGELAALLVKRVLEQTLDATVTLCRSADLDVDDRKAFVESLGLFMSKVHAELEKGEPDTTCFAPLGGYKVMTALGYVAGSVAGYPMAYTHERTEMLHFVPPIPMQLDASIIERHGVFLKRVRHGCEVAALTHEEQKVLRDHAFLFEQTGGYAGLSAFGVFWLDRTDPTALAMRVLLTEDALRTLECGDRAYAAKELRMLSSRLRDPARFTASLHHQTAFPNGTLPLYKGSSGNAGVFRATYRYEQATDTLRIFHLWLDHDAYEREAKLRVRETPSDADAIHEGTAMLIAGRE